MTDAKPRHESYGTLCQLSYIRNLGDLQNMCVLLSFRVGDMAGYSQFGRRWYSLYTTLAGPVLEGAKFVRTALII
jgi:hypothetical protein